MTVPSALTALPLFPNCNPMRARKSPDPFQDALNAGVVNVVTSSDHALGSQLVEDPRVDLVSFTGSTATGRSVMTAAAQGLKRVFLELGGKSAFIVLDDADLRAACSYAAFNVAAHAGQGCAITTRLLVPRAKYDEAVEITAKSLRRIGVGDPNDDNTVDLYDLSSVLEDYGMTSGGINDLDGDGSVGLPDLNIVLVNFETTGY